MMDEEAFIAANTRPGRAALVPEFVLRLADEITPIWQASETALQQAGVDPPFWAFAWPGGQALARLILDEPTRVKGRRVLDFAAGGGIASLAAAHAGASLVEAVDIDALARAAIRFNAAANTAAVTVLGDDLVGTICRWDLVLCGDVFYEAKMTRHILPWLRQLASIAEVWVADPGRAYLPVTGLEPLARMTVPTSLELEDREERHVTIYRLLAEAP